MHLLSEDSSAATLDSSYRLLCFGNTWRLLSYA
jgi:hypothetical protein